MKLLVTAAAAGLAVTLAQVKLHLRLDPSSNHEDDLLRMLIKVSMERASHETGRALLTTGYSLTADSRERLKLPAEPDRNQRCHQIRRPGQRHRLHDRRLHRNPDGSHCRGQAAGARLLSHRYRLHRGIRRGRFVPACSNLPVDFG